ncbi:hypothetical protein E4T66_17765 [Sinimarinibacterium sp. CAU 1509]|uniref:hypothetical protein n=1 Tax=Sinimarinibacterium sp. CAU 1509 TaxID=2562283 RepID=UPI0010AC9B8E|nr:hypothetical protein [Sinimarinibacterium sp. CAU 1509]TJY57255.1 hypothetical protein E4T66_17765 [Sinimarinibacterium sp. CAU 1509]
MDPNEQLKRLAQATLARTQQAQASGSRDPVPPLYMVPTGEQLRTLTNAERLAPKMPGPGRVGLWVWFYAGDPEGEDFLTEVLAISEHYRAILDITYYCVIVPRRIPKTVSFESVINRKIVALPDIGGNIATKYAGGQVPAIVLVVGEDRRLVTLRQLKDYLARNTD